MSETKAPLPGFKFKMGGTPCEISYVTGIVASPKESTVTTTTTTTDEKGNRERRVSTTQLQDFHLVKDNGREISVATRNEAINVREGHCLSLIRCKTLGRKGKGQVFNLGFVNHHTDEIEMLVEHWSTIFTSNLFIGLAVILASIYGFDLYLQGDLIFSLFFGIPVGLFLSKVVYIYGVYNPAVDKLDRKLTSYMESIRDYGNEHEFHKRAG